MGSAVGVSDELSGRGRQVDFIVGHEEGDVTFPEESLVLIQVGVQATFGACRHLVHRHGAAQIGAGSMS
jgi:hypothetical protein